ncbi:MAG TPA: sugar porter family MFS transporter, partial [bacterium]|nr:sugar porter family MFS transporter [bacterium]
SDSVGVLVACRLLIGLAIGVASYTAPLYLSEVAPPHLRGGLVSLNQLMITIGIFASYMVDYALSGNNEWRWMFGLGVIPAVILVLGMIFLPETPRWLISKRKKEAALKILARVNPGRDVTVDLSEIETTLSQKEGSWKEVFQPWLRPALIVGIMLAFFQQVTGINTVIYYAPTIFQFAGFESAKVSILATAGIGLVNVLMTVVAVWLLDRLGRKPLLYIGLVGMAASLGFLGYAFQSAALSGAVKWITVASLVVYIASFAISLGPIFWLIIAEIYPLHVRGRAMSMATVANWLFNMLVAATFLTLIEKLGKAGTFWFFGIMSVICIAFSWRYVPETKGRTLEEIEAHLKKNTGMRGFGSL